MTEHISEQEWMEYLGSALERARAAELRDHANTGAPCGQWLAELTTWHRMLAAEGARLRRAMELPAGEMDRFVTQSMEKICDSRPAGLRAAYGRTAAEGMFLLRSLIEPIFGSGTTRLTIDLAVRRCTVRPEHQLSGREWPLFVSNLSETLTSICGSAAGRLINRAGNALLEEAA